MSARNIVVPEDSPHREGASLNIPTAEDSQTGNFTPSVSRKRGGASFSRRLEPRSLPETPTIPMTPSTDELYGCGALTPKAFQFCNNPRWVLVFLCGATFLQGMIINGFINTVISSIERRFDLSSSQVGLIASTYDITSCIGLSFVSYFGGTGHKPRWLGWGVMIMGLGSFVFTLPHFATPLYQDDFPGQTGICTANPTVLCKNRVAGGVSGYLFVFMLAQVLHGLGATPLYTLGVTYLDENVKSNYAPVYIGIFYTAAIVGPAAGYLLGGVFLDIYTEINQATKMTPESPHWVGAWWVGFLGTGVASLLVGIPILGFPRQLPDSQEVATTRVSEAHQVKDGSQATASDSQFGKSIKDMPRSVLLLLKNLPFLFICLAGATETILLAGMSTFGPKFLESQFRLSASDAATYFGILVVPAGGGGTFLGGYIVKRWNMRCRPIIYFCMVCAIVSLLAMFIFLIHCPNVSMAGVNVPYQHNLTGPQHFDPLMNSSSLGQSLTVGCNSACNCATELYNPVCGADGVTYYSPCYAGCTGVNRTGLSARKMVYSGCSCVVGNMTWGEEGFARSGKCSSSCNSMPAFLCLLFIIIFFTFLSSMPALTATLRCVPDRQKSFALGIQWILVRLLGSIPGPIAFGSLIDQSCLLWEDRCGEQGSCYLYQNQTMSLYSLGAGILYKVLGTLLFLVAGLLYQPPSQSVDHKEDSVNVNARA